jgi:hypothetical protein
LYNLSELLRKRYEESRSRGVVGSKGRNMPNIANDKEINPSACNMYFFIP